MMRIRLAALLILAFLPLINVIAAPAPDPSAILDVGPPPKEQAVEDHRKAEIGRLTLAHGMLFNVWRDPDVSKLPSVAPLKDARSWLAKNLRVMEEDGGSRLRLTFQAGTREEQVVILNALLRVKLRCERECIKDQEGVIRMYEANILDLEQRIASGQHSELVDSYRKGIDDL